MILSTETIVAPAAYLTTWQAARRLGVAITTVNAWVDDGRLPGFRTPGGHRRIRGEDFEEFIRRHNYGRVADRERSVLVVDDHDAVRRSIARTIRAARLGVGIFEAADGFEAGRLIVEKKPDVVVLDIHLPGIDGFRVMQRIRSLAFAPAVIAISGHSPERYRRKSLKLGAVAFFAKPFESALLVEALRKVLEGKGLAGVGDGSAA
jgi:two-component system, OmpR family, response regulator